MNKCLTYLTRVGLIAALVSICLFTQGGTVHADPMELVANRTQNSKLFSLGGNTYALNTSLGAMHYWDGSGLWQNIDCDYSEVDTGNFTARFTKLPYLVRMGDDCRRRIYPDRNDLSYWFEVSKPFASMGTPTKVGAYWVWNFPNAIIAVTIRAQAVKLGFRLKNSLAPSSITFPFSSQGITRDGNQLLHDGVPVAHLQKPGAIDANGVERDCTVSFDAGQVTISLNTTGLTYPIDVDPTFSVGASSDDCTVTDIDGYFPPWGAAITLTSTSVLMGEGSGGSTHYGHGMRFTSVTIPQGATITTSYVTWVCGESVSSTPCNVALSCQAADNATTFSTLADYNGRSHTDYVYWSPGAWTIGSSYNSTSIVDPVQDVISRAGWASGNALVVFSEAYVDSSGTVYRRGASWDHASYNPPALYVEYSVPSAAGFSFGYIMGA